MEDSAASFTVHKMYSIYDHLFICEPSTSWKALYAVEIYFASHIIM